MKSNLSRSGKQRFWEEHLARWNSSGLSQVEYCRINKIGLSSFRSWNRKTKRRNAPALVELPLPKSFHVPVFRPHPQLCLVVDQHYRIEIGKGFDCDDLERVVRVLGRI